MRPRPLLAVLAGLAVLLLLSGAAWALLRPAGAGDRPVPAPIDVPAREEPAVPEAPRPGGEADPAPAPPPAVPTTPAPDVVPPPPLTDDDDDDDDDGPGDSDDDPDVDDDGDD